MFINTDTNVHHILSSITSHLHTLPPLTGLPATPHSRVRHTSKHFWTSLRSTTTLMTNSLTMCLKKPRNSLRSCSSNSQRKLGAVTTSYVLVPTSTRGGEGHYINLVKMQTLNFLSMLHTEQGLLLLYAWDVVSFPDHQQDPQYRTEG